MSNIPIVSFNSGLVTPHVDARNDSEKYQSACRVLDNFIARMYGSAERRPGTYYIGGMRDSDDSDPVSGVTTALLIPFIYNKETSYILEFTNLYIRVYYGDAVIDEINSPYAESDLFDLQFKQLGDVIRITHDSYNPAVISRISASQFAISDLKFDYGPFLLRNDLANPDNPNNITMTPSGTGISVLSAQAQIAQTGLIMWTDFNPSHGIDGLETTYCGGGYWGKQFQSDMTYRVYFDTAQDIDQLNINYMCVNAIQPAGNLPDNTYTKRGLRVYDGSDWTTLVNPNTPDADFTATSYDAWDYYNTMLGANSNVTFTDLGLTGITAIEIYLYVYQASTSSLPAAVAVFNVSIGGSSVELETATLTSSSDYFDSDMVGSLFYLIQPKIKTNTNGTKTTPATGDLTTEIVTHGTFSVSIHTGWTGTVSLYRKQGLNAWESWASWNAASNNKAVDESFYESGRNVYYKLVVESLTGGVVQGEINLKESIQTGICRVVAYNSATNVDVAVISPFSSETATTRWAEGAWSDYRGYPSSCCFIEDRCVYGGMKSLANGTSLATVWLSATGDYENYDEGTNGADSFSVTIMTTETLVWVDAMDNLLVGTTGGIFMIRSSRMDSVMVPNPPPICRQQSAYPCDAKQPVKMMKTMVYLSGRQLRELAYDRGSYSSDNDLTALCEQITASPIIDMGLQTNPDTILWTVHADGRLSAFVYDRENNVMAWANMPLALSGDGITPKVKSVAVIPDYGSGDDIYVAVYRMINGPTIYDGAEPFMDETEEVRDKMSVVYIEKFAKRFE